MLSKKNPMQYIERKLILEVITISSFDRKERKNIIIVPVPKSKA